MKKLLLTWLLVFITSVTIASGVCTTPTNNMVVTSSVTFCNGTYNLPDGISIGSDDISIVCNSTILNGSGYVTLDKYGINNTGYDGVGIFNCTIQNYGNGLYAPGWYIQNTTHNLIIVNNTLTMNHNGLYVTNSRDSLIEGNTGHENNIIQFRFFNITNCIIANNTASDILTDGGGGMTFELTNNSIIENNTMDDSEVGMLFRNSHYNKIRNNLFINNSRAASETMFFEDGSSLNNVTGNGFEHSTNGIGLYFCNDILISDNSITDTIYNGIFFRSSDGSENITLIQNNITFSGSNGIRRSYNNNIVVENNTIYHTDYTDYYDYYNEVSSDTSAEYQWWGTTNASEIAEHIYDYYDDDSKGVVDFCPFLDAPWPDGNASGEYYISRNCSGGACDSSTDDVSCCDQQSECVYGGYCYESASDFAGLWCENGIWNIARFTLELVMAEYVAPSARIAFLINGTRNQNLKDFQNWSVNFGDGVQINGTVPFNLTNESILIAVDHEYTGCDNYSVLIEADYNGTEDSIETYIETCHLDLHSLNASNATTTGQVYFLINNTGKSDVTDVWNWSIDFGDNYVLNGSIDFNLTVGEAILVAAIHGYSLSDTYTIKAMLDYSYILDEEEVQLTV